jgi:hypothetical protein
MLMQLIIPKECCVGQDWFDRFAIGASGLCLLHCLLLPVFLVGLPSGVHALGGGETFHLAILFTAIPLSLLGLIGGRKIHQNIRPVQLGGLGVLLLATGVSLELAQNQGLGTMITVCGSLILVGAHVLNWKLRGAALRSR